MGDLEHDRRYSPEDRDWLGGEVVPSRDTKVYMFSGCASVVRGRGDHESEAADAS